MKKGILIFTTFILLLVACNSNKDPFKSMILKDLGNWEQINGNAPYTLEDGIIIGRTVLNSPNSFLCSREKYSDFILEFDTWFDGRMNAGVQIRSESRPDYQNGRVHGYQVEFDPSSRAWSGGIYDEARRGWLYPLDNNPEGKKALRVEEWNHYRIEAIGNSIRTWVNGIPCADLIDDMTPSGFIALQVHSIQKDSSKTGMEVKWKNIRILTEDLEKYVTPYTPVIPQISYLTNVLTEREAGEGWKMLFDGKSSESWMNAKTRTFPSGWEIRDGSLNINPQAKQGGDIVTKDKYRNFELRFDFLYTPGANSGVKYFVDTESNDGKLSSIGCEYQVLDNKRHPDAKMGVNGNRTLASLYDLIPAKRTNDLGPDKWQNAVIKVEGNKVQHYLNGQLAVDYERGNDEWRNLVASSKFKDFNGFGEAAEGRILLQDHGDSVSYRNIKIRTLN